MSSSEFPGNSLKPPIGQPKLISFLNTTLKILSIASFSDDYQTKTRSGRVTKLTEKVAGYKKAAGKRPHKSDGKTERPEPVTDKTTSSRMSNKISLPVERKTRTRPGVVSSQTVKLNDVEETNNRKMIVLLSDIRRTLVERETTINEVGETELKMSIEPKSLTVQPKTESVLETTESTSRRLQSVPSKEPPKHVSVYPVAIEDATLKSSPAMTSSANLNPVQRSPVYSQVVVNSTLPVKSPVVAVQSPSAVPKRPVVDDNFALMPLKQRSQRIKKNLETPVVNNPDKDDVYGFDFNDSVEAEKVVKKVAKKSRNARPKPPGHVKNTVKKVEPTGMRLWDDKDFNHRQKQIKLNLKNKDFKPKEKRIPSVVNMRPQMNSTMKNAITAPSSDIQITAIDNLIPNVEFKEQGDNSNNSSGMMPWRYSTIHHQPPSLGNITMTSLNDSNGENVNPTGCTNAASKAQVSLATNSLQRSPMKELNPNETYMEPRPHANKEKLSTLKRRTFGLENNFGFESDGEEEDQNNPQNLDVKRRKFDENIDSLKKFRHSLTLVNSPLNSRSRPKPTRSAVPLSRSIFTTSTPQQVKIRDAFKSSTATAVTSKESKGSVADPETSADPKLFESLTFEVPPKRNYSSIRAWRKKKVDFYGFSDDEVSEDECGDVQNSCDVFEGQTKLTKKTKVQKVQEVRDQFLY